MYNRPVAVKELYAEPLKCLV